MYFEEIVDEIETTLDKLIENAKLMQDAAHIKEKIVAFQKTQEGLLEHLHSMNAFLEKNKKIIKISKEKQAIIANKLTSFEKVNSNFIKNASKNARLIKAKKKDNN